MLDLLAQVLQRSSSAAGQLMTEPISAFGHTVGAPRIVARPASCEAAGALVRNVGNGGCWDDYYYSYTIVIL